MFVDEVDIVAAAGDGGSGCMSFRREKFVPRGGPDGGNGGWGGSVYLVAAPNLNTLVSFRYHPEFKANRGGNGEGSNRTGRSGQDLDILVPAGTVATAVDEHGERRVGGRPDLRRRSRAGRPRRPRRPRQRGVRLVDQPGAAAIRSRRAGRDRLAAPAPEAARRRRADRLSERRQVDADLGDLRGQAEDRRLPVHDAGPEPRRRRPRRRSQLRRRRRPRPDRRRPHRRRPRPSLPRPRRAQRGARPPRRRVVAQRPRSGRGLRDHPPRAGALRAGRRRRARAHADRRTRADRRAVEDRRARRAGAAREARAPRRGPRACRASRSRRSPREGVGALLEAVWPHVAASKAAAAAARQAAQQAMLANPEPGPRSHAAGKAAADRRAAHE